MQRHYHILLQPYASYPSDEDGMGMWMGWAWSAECGKCGESGGWGWELPSTLNSI